MAAYGYDYHDKLCRVTSNFPGEGNVTYEYGGDGKRRLRYSASGNNAYWWHAGYNVIEESASGMFFFPNANYVIDHPAASRGNVLADIQGYDPVTGTARYYTQDHLGSTRTIRSQAKATLARFDYDPYGGPTYHDGASATRTYTGYDLDPVTGMYFAPFRYYAAGLARWTARDPLGMVDGPSLYAYVKGSPSLHVDVTGLRLEGCPTDFREVFYDVGFALSQVPGNFWNWIADNTFFGITVVPMMAGECVWAKPNGETGGGPMATTQPICVSFDFGIGTPGDHEVDFGPKPWLAVGITWDTEHHAIVFHLGIGSPSIFGPITLCNSRGDGNVQDWHPPLTR